MIHRVIRLGVPIREETPMNIRYHVELNEAERSELNSLISGGKKGRLMRPFFLFA